MTRKSMFAFVANAALAAAAVVAGITSAQPIDGSAPGAWPSPKS